MFDLNANEHAAINVAALQTYFLNADDPDCRLSALIPETFTLDTPIKMVLYTCHPQDSNANMVIQQASPRQCFRFVNQTSHGPDFSKAHKFHRHDFYELMYVVEGTVYQNIEHQRHVYPAGSCCLFNRNIYHTEEHQGEHSLVFLQFTSEYILELLGQPTSFPQTRDEIYQEMENFFYHDISVDPAADKKYIDFIPLQPPEWIQQNITGPLAKAFSHLQKPMVASDLHLKAIILELLCNLFEPKHYQQAPMHLGSTAEQNLFDAITRYLTDKHGRASRRELENHFCYSGDYLYKVVRKFTGMSLFDYGMKLCLNEASYLLASTNLSVGQIMVALKFTNQTHFYKHFKDTYQMTPKEYRRHMKQGVISTQIVKKT